MRVRYADAKGRTRTIQRAVRRVIPAKKSVRVRTGLGPIKDRDQLRRLRIDIYHARVVRAPGA
ncbi:MAG: hypothetical protein ETSY1_39540 [Candidatus Entotheonella factor]|uniref:Uncharacterized protein n=1 Tax=Entotheonella factor TaxID=1429438 RepID=W4L5L2_ENTF1|nr:MAG: hypothetical protein ETSY1_39540 [Candidatus Entotheonella factor]